MEYRYRKVKMTVLACMGILVYLICASSSYAANTKIRTYYTGTDIIGTGMTEREERYKVTSYLVKKRIKYSKRREIGEIKNNTSKAATKSLSISRSTTRTCSLSASAVIPERVMQNDVSLTIGGSLSFNYTISLSASAKVPARKSKSVYLQYKTTTCQYKYVIQRQQRKLYGKWKNRGKLTVQYNNVNTKVPVLVV